MEEVSTPFGGRPGGRVGERLKAAREERGITREDIAMRTRIPVKSLELIEAGATEGLPALTYTAGFVRSYATALGLEGATYARQFREEMGQPVRRDLPEPYAPADPTRLPSRFLAIVALLLAIAVAGGYAIWRGDGLFGGGADDRARLAAGTDTAVFPPAETAPAQPVPAVPPPAAPASTTGPVVIAAKEEAWLRVSEREGKTLFMGILGPAQRYEVPATAIDPVLRTSRPQSLDIMVGAVTLPPLAAPDTLIRAASLKREALLAAVPAVPPAFGPPVATPSGTP